MRCKAGPGKPQENGQQKTWMRRREWIMDGMGALEGMVCWGKGFYGIALRG